MIKPNWLHLFTLLLLTQIGCASAYEKSLGGDTDRVFPQIYLTDFEAAWQASLEAIKSMKLDQATNKESGYIQTQWMDNTEQRNFVDPYAGNAVFLKAKVRFRISVSKGFYEGQPSVKIAVRKEQVVQYDPLEGWVKKGSDGVEEKTLIYRIGRIIVLRSRIAQIEQEATEEAIEDATF